MAQSISQFALVVKDYDEAIEFYTKKLGFIVKEDTVLSDTKRWVVICPRGAGESGCNILLAKAANEAQESRIGNQTGGRVFLFLNTDDFENDYQNLLKNNVKIVREPEEQAYGKVLVFADLYGNLWDLIGREKS
jgi:catechol 2,3-dioxygenase-like lactoylglutathione lyase family enzyme